MDMQQTTETTKTSLNGVSVLILMMAVSTGLIVLQLLLINTCGSSSCDYMVAGATGQMNWPMF